MDEAENKQDKVLMLPSVGHDEKLKDAEIEVDDDEVRIIPIEEFTPKSKNPRKRRAKKLRAPLSSEFVRCSKRLNKDLDCFRNKESMLADAEGSMMEDISEGGAYEEEAHEGKVLMPRALAMVPETDEAPVFYAPPSAEQVEPAPFLGVDNVQALATGFLKMQPGAVSSAALLESSDE